MYSHLFWTSFYKTWYISFPDSVHLGICKQSDCTLMTKQTEIAHGGWFQPQFKPWNDLFAA